MRSAPNAARVGAFWFGIQVVWGALLGVSLQVRLTSLDPHDPVRAYGLLAALGAMVAAITQIVAGRSSDRRRRSGSRRLEFYIAGTLVSAGALFWFYLAPTMLQFAAALVVLQAAMNVAIGPYQAAIPEVFDESHWARASSWMAGLQSAGNAVGALVAGTVTLGVADAAAVAVALLLTATITVAHLRSVAFRPADETRFTVARSFADLFISRALVYAGLYTLLGYLYFYLAAVQPQHARMTTGLLLVLFLIAGAGGAAIAAGPVARADRRLSAALGGGLFIVALVVLVTATGVNAAVAAAAVGGIGWGYFLTADWALGCGFLPRGALALSMGIWNLALLLPQMVAPLAATAAIAATRAHGSAAQARVAFLLAALETAAGLLWLRRLPGGRVKAQKPGKPARAIGQGEL